jgi:GxxExxY protein
MPSFSIHKLQPANAHLTEQLRAYAYDVIGCCQVVHRDMGPFLNEYMYQEALAIAFNESNIPFQREYYFSVLFHGQPIKHKHFVDFLVRDDTFVECKAIEHIGTEQRQQLWNYMRLTSTRIGILYNFAPVKDECERYYLDATTGMMYAF